MGHCVTSQILGASNKIKALIALLEVYPTEAAKLTRVRKIQQEIYPLLDLRNRVVHDVWFKDEKTGSHFRHQLVDKQGKVMLENVPVDFDEIDRIVQGVTALRKKFVTLWINLPWRGTYPTTSILLQ